MRAPTLVCALASSIVLASGVASAQEPTPAPSSSSTWFEPAPPEQKKPTDKPAPDATPKPEPADVAAEAPPAAEPEKAKAPEKPVEAAGSRARKPAAPAPSDKLAWKPAMSRPKTNVIIGGGMGLVSGRFSHPDLVGTSFNGISAGLHAGVALSPSFVVGVDFDAYRTSVSYLGDDKYGYKGADNPRFVPEGAQGGGARLTATCVGCRPPPGGGVVVQGPLNVLTLGPRLQFAPDPARGLYAAVTGGVTFLEGTLENRGALAIGARGGYRIGLSDQVGIALEAGTTAHRFTNTTSVFGFGGLQLQLRL